MYVRVSTAYKSRQGDAVVFDQNPGVQEQPLRDLVAQRGWVVFQVYSDCASGAADRRPGLDALMRDARRGGFDVVIVLRSDRFARRHGSKSGRSIGRPRAVFDRSVAMRLRAKRKSWGYIALRLHTSVGSVRRACQAGLPGEMTPILGQLPAIMPKTPEPVLDGVPRIGGDSIPSRSA